jgi:hypothetical protein
MRGPGVRGRRAGGGDDRCGSCRLMSVASVVVGRLSHCRRISHCWIECQWLQMRRPLSTEPEFRTEVVNHQRNLSLPNDDAITGSQCGSLAISRHAEGLLVPCGRCSGSLLIPVAGRIAHTGGSRQLRRAEYSHHQGSQCFRPGVKPVMAFCRTMRTYPRAHWI